MLTDWDDYRVFLTLARERSLTAAAKALNVSHPTVARRVKSLEDAIGARLFDRLPDGYVLTPAAEQLLADVEAMDDAAQAIERRSLGLSDTARGTVRVSVGEHMMQFLTRHLVELRDRLPEIEIEFHVTHLMANLSRREADISIREVVPDAADLVTRRIGRFRYAVYGTPQLVGQIGSSRRDALNGSLAYLPWIGFDEEHHYMPGQAWIRRLLGNRAPAIRTNNGNSLHYAVSSGAGVTVLPCFIGDIDPNLVRATPVLEDVIADQWMLVHRDLRTLPRVRAMMDELARLFQKEKGVLEGVA
ncbi:MAG: LysR family transcriptional regulator [Nisaea sp.]|uniref:LysR family transcriptional regulator n=1 Tax=Nisaea sp. TaxID=2024842 RepID=UPI001B1E4D02|nr:LysR family transcriptional regulator [Nisaea sp.]MBO6559530.1 LysR family transcriptional regulator [Nisaea sp.]